MIQSGNISAASRKRLMEERRKKQETSTLERARFNSCMDKVRDKGLISELDNLIKNIQREGERLSHFRSMSQLDHYKKKVKEFLSKVNNKTFKVKPTGYVDATGDYSTQLVVEKVDQALEDLTTYVFTKENQPLQILEQLDLIKGILTDLYQ